MIRFAGLDSGKKRDQSALVSIQVLDDGKALIEGCRVWPVRTEYHAIEEDVAAYHIKQNWKAIGVEVNGIGEHVAESLRRRGLPIKPITTVARLSGDRVQKTKAQRLARSMPKNEMVLQTLKLKQEGKIKWPKATPETRKLKEQLTAFQKHTTEAGNVRYAAPGDASDDLVLAMIMALFLAMPHLDTGRDTSHVGGPIYPTETDTYTMRQDMEMEGWQFAR